MRLSFGKWESAALRTYAVSVTMVALGLTQTLYFIDVKRLQFTLNFATTILFLLLAILLFYGPGRLSTRTSILVISWLALILNTRLTLQPLDQVLHGQPGTRLAGVWVAGFAAWMIALIAAAILSAVPRCRSRLSTIVSWLERFPGWIALTVFVAAGVSTVVYRAAVEGVTNRWAIDRFMGNLALLVGCIAILKLMGLPNPSQGGRAADISWRWFWGSLVLIATVYAVQAFRIGLNGLYWLNPDGVAYLIIARDFARGAAVIRGNWSPLMPLLLAPPIRLGADPQIAQRVFAGLGGLVWTGLALALGHRAGLSRFWLVALAATMAIIALQLAFYPVTPDALSALILAGYFLLVTSGRFLRRPVLFGVLAGLLGALAFYAKFYNLPFFVVHIFVTGLLIVAHGGSLRRAMIAVLAAWAVAALLIAPWALLLRSRYGYFTLTTSGAINHAAVGPSNGGTPCWDQRLCDEPADVLIPYEDTPAVAYADYGWNVFGSMDNLRYQISLTGRTIAEFLGQVSFELGPLPPLTIVFLVISLFVVHANIQLRFLLLWSLMTVVLYAGGYMLFHNELRYFLPILPIPVVGLYRTIQAGFDKARANGVMSRAGLAQSVVFGAAVLSFVAPQAAGLGPLPPDTACLKVQALAYANELVTPIAGSDSRINKIAFYAEKRTLGVLPPTTTVAVADSQLRQMGVRTYVVMRGLPLADELVARGGYSIAASPNICGDDFLFLRTPVP